MRKSLLLAIGIGILLAAPMTASATTDNIHMGGMCSTQFSGGKGGMCYSGKRTNHQAWWSCEHGSLNHNDLKMKPICNDGGSTGCP